LQNAARRHGVELSVFGVAGPEEIVAAIDAAKASGAEAINFLATPLFSVPGSRSNRIVIERVAELRLPAIYQWPETAGQGGLVGYGPRFTQVWRQRARLVVKVLRGVNPADLPVEQPTKFEMVINLKTAKALGLDVPAWLSWIAAATRQMVLRLGAKPGSPIGQRADMRQWIGANMVARASRAVSGERALIKILTCSAHLCVCLCAAPFRSRERA
jgi:ABC-type uncharacterized transport system substrate-binding protein